jgi:hypothetical protein
MTHTELDFSQIEAKVEQLNGDEAEYVETWGLIMDRVGQ